MALQESGGTVSTYQVQLGEYCAIMESCYEVLYVWDWVSVWNGHAVQSPVVTTGSPVSRCFLRDHV